MMQKQSNGFWRVFLGEVHTILHSPKVLVWCLGAPFAIFFLYASIFKDGVLRKLPLAVVDEDKTAVSREIIRQLDANSTIHIAQYADNEEEAAHLVRTSQVFGFVVIPSRLEQKLNTGQPENVLLYINNNYLTPAGLVYKAFNTTLASFSATAAANGWMKKGVPAWQAKVLVQPVVVGNHTLFNPYVNYAYYLCLSLFPMALQLSVMVNTLYVLGRVLKYNKGRELLQQSGGSVWNAYWGKTLPYTILFALLAMVMVGYLFGYMHIPVNVPYMTVWLLTLQLILVYQLIGVFFVTICKDFRTLASIGGGYSALAFSFSGYTFPAEGMPVSIQVVDAIFPFASYARMLTNTAVKGMPVSSSLTYLLGFGLFAIIGLLSLVKFKTMLEKGHYEKA